MEPVDALIGVSCFARQRMRRDSFHDADLNGGSETALLVALEDTECTAWAEYARRVFNVPGPHKI